MTPRNLSLLACLWVCLVGASSAEGRLRARLSLTGMYYAEQQGTEVPRLATTGQLAFGDLRVWLDGDRLARGRLDLRLDLRLRGTAGFDYARKFDTSDLTPEARERAYDASGKPLMDRRTEQEGASGPADPYAGGVSARGYLGGREYDLREAYLRVNLTERVSLQLGRSIVTEASATKVDGLRVLLRLGPRWEGSAFVGGYPNPYSRSLLTDYTPPVGNGVACGDAPLESLVPRVQDPDTSIFLDKNLYSVPALPGALRGDGIRVAALPCESVAQLSLTAGLTARYQYEWIWGQLGLVGAYLGGPGGGGPVALRDTYEDLTYERNQEGTRDKIRVRPGIDERPLPTLQEPGDALDAPRVFVSWMNLMQLGERASLLSDILIDLYGSAGPQPTRIALQGTLRPLRSDRLQLRLSYTHLSSLAIEMFLRQLLYNRYPNGTTLNVGADGVIRSANPGVVENNLTVLRTGRDEVRGGLDLRLAGRLHLALDGRFRYRQLLSGGSNAAVYEEARWSGGALYGDQTAPFAGDATVGLRDGGSLAGLRAGLSYTFLSDFRARNHIGRVSLGRDFLGQRLGLDASYLFVATRDAGAGQDNSACASRYASAQVNPFLAACYGRRSGESHEAGLSLTALPTPALFLYLDYRFTVLRSDPQQGALPQIPEVVPTVFGHALIGRIEYRM